MISLIDGVIHTLPPRSLLRRAIYTFSVVGGMSLRLRIANGRAA
jgi:hypothetical protein